jgi:hypothetical protein
MIRMASRILSILALAMVVVTGTMQSQPVLLQIRPHVGDTLSVQFQQEVEMTGMPPGCGSNAGAFRPRLKSAPVNCAGLRTMNTKMEVFSRAIAQRTTRDATDLLAITDSVLTTSGSATRRVKQPAQRAPVELRVSTDGEVELGEGPASDEMRKLFGQMPATLSRKPVSVGERWVHEMNVPLEGEPGATGRVRTTFQLDSLGRNGDVAYISLRGELSHAHSDGSGSETSGSLIGTMQFNRRLAWITETHAVIEVWSNMRAPKSSQPMDVHTRVVQSLNVTGSR